jgi:hypothetical protein
MQGNITTLQANAYQQQAQIGNLQASAYSNVNVSIYLNSQGYNLYSNVNVAAYLSTYTGAIKGANLNVSGAVISSNVAVNGNVTAQYLFGNGSQISGLNPTVLNYLTTGVAGNIIPSANLTYSLGSPTRQWKDLWLSGNTLYLGGVPLTINNGNLSVDGVSIAANLQTSLPNYSGNIGSLTVTGNLTVTGTTTTVNTEIVNQNEIVAGTATANTIVSNTAIISGNITAQYFIGNGSQLTGVFAAVTPTYETIAQNLSAYPFVINRQGTLISNVVYSVPGPLTITKSFTYDNDLITSIALYGSALPFTYTKNLTYSGTSISGASYSVY